jgi:putative hydrolase of the HAD superfamily
MTVPDESLYVLGELRRRDLRIGLVSNAHFLPEMMREDIDRFGVAAFVDNAVFSSEAGVRKPHPDIFTRVLTALAVSPPAALFVGDRLADDIAGAQRVGMKTALTTEYRQEVPGTGGIIPDYVVARLRDLLPIVDELVAAG